MGTKTSRKSDFWRSFFLFGAVRDRYRHRGSAALAGLYSHTPSAHHFKPLPDVFQCSMRLIFVSRLKTGAVVFHDDMSTGVRVPCPDGDVKRIGIQVHAVLDGVFHNGL